MASRVLLLLPGLMCDRDVFEPLVPALAPHVRCIVAEYHGESSIAAMATRALAAAPSSFAVLGHSMGGRVALEVYRRARERVERIALLDTGYAARPVGEAGKREAEQRGALLAVARLQGMRAMADQWVRIPMVHPARLQDRPLVDAVLTMIGRRTPDEFAAEITALLERPDASSVLAGIVCPSLVLCGRDDAWATVDRHVEMHQLIANSALAVIESCGHMAPMERPAEVAAALVEWLGR